VSTKKKPFLEMKVRAETPEQKAAFEEAARRSQPELSLNQWLLAAALEKLARDKKGGR